MVFYLMSFYCGNYFLYISKHEILFAEPGAHFQNAPDDSFTQQSMHCAQVHALVVAAGAARWS
jgi:hypothetical protein